MPSHLPSRTEAWARMRAANPPAWVLEHVACVEQLATAMATAAGQNGHTVDMALIQAGAIMHDIGRSITQEPKHAHLGAEILRGENMDARVVQIVERHTGAGILPEEAQSIGVPANDYTPISLEEKIVAHADNLYSGAKRLNLQQLQAKYQAKELPDAWQRIKELHAELSLICGTDLENLAPADLPSVD